MAKARTAAGRRIRIVHGDNDTPGADQDTLPGRVRRHVPTLAAEDVGKPDVGKAAIALTAGFHREFGYLHSARPTTSPATMPKKRETKFMFMLASLSR